jgi:hypothetical protein
LPAIDPNSHISFPGEFETVVNQVGDHLHELGLIPDQHVRHSGIHGQPDLQMLALCRWFHRPNDFLQGGSKGEGLLSQFETSGLEFGKVKNIIDNGHQSDGGTLNQLKVLPLCRGHLFLEENIGQTDNTIHGCPDLMTHIGKEFSLGDTGRLRRRSGLFKLPFRCLSF